MCICKSPHPCPSVWLSQGDGPGAQASAARRPRARGAACSTGSGKREVGPLSAARRPEVAPPSTKRRGSGGAPGGGRAQPACVPPRRPRGCAWNANIPSSQLKSLGPGAGRRVSTDFGRFPARLRLLPGRGARPPLAGAGRPLPLAPRARTGLLALKTGSFPNGF